MKHRKYWAGFSGGKLVVDLDKDNYGFAGRPAIFTHRKEARKRFQDVRPVEVREIEQ